MYSVKECIVCKSTHKVCKSPLGFLCGKHYQQWKKYGKVKNRTKNDPNEIRDNNDGTSSIVLYNRNSEPIAEALIDTSKVPLVSEYKWCIDKNGYVKNSKQMYLHRVIMQESCLYVDHINGDKLNNTLNNLRTCSNADNLKNRVKLPINNKSGILGVHFKKDRNKWYSEIKVDGVIKRLGSFSSKEDAIKARIEAEVLYFKEFKPKVNSYEIN